MILSQSKHPMLARRTMRTIRYTLYSDTNEGKCLCCHDGCSELWMLKRFCLCHVNCLQRLQCTDSLACTDNARDTRAHTYTQSHTYMHYITLHYITLHYTTLHTYIHTCIHTHIHTCIHTYIHTHITIVTHARTHASMQRHTRKKMPVLSLRGDATGPSAFAMPAKIQCNDAL